MKQTTLKDLYMQEIEDLLSAETQLVNTLPKVAAAIQNTKLRATIEAHLLQTKTHVERLNKVFNLLGAQPKMKVCEAMKGLLKEGAQSIDEIELGPVRDAALIGACQRVEHYEMAAYGATRQFARTLGFSDQAALLDETLREEEAANRILMDIAIDTVNPAAKEIGLVHA